MDDKIIRVGKPLPLIERIDILDGMRVAIDWRSGSRSVVDLAPVILSHRAFIALRDDDALFRTMRVNEDGNALEWHGGAELAAEWIEHLPSTGMESAEFREIMDRLGLSLDGMAVQLGISRRLIASYRKDQSIPNHIAFAARYLDARL